MKHLLLVICFLSNCLCSLFAQGQNQLMEDKGLSIAYLYPQFQKGKIRFRDGTISIANLNVNLYQQQLVFIQNNDTLTVFDRSPIDYLCTGGDTIYYSNGFYKLLSSKTFPKVLVKYVATLADMQKTGVYNIPSRTTRIESYQTYVSGRANDKIKVDETLLFAIEKEFAFLDSHGVIRRANVASIQQLFPSYKSEIRNYIKDHRIKFTSLEDINQLVSYANKEISK